MALHVVDDHGVVAADFFGAVAVQRDGQVVGVGLVDDGAAANGGGDFVAEAFLEVFHLLGVDRARGRHRAGHDREQRDVDAEGLLDDRELAEEGLDALGFLACGFGAGDQAP